MHLKMWKPVLIRQPVSAFLCSSLVLYTAHSPQTFAIFPFTFWRSLSLSQPQPAVLTLSWFLLFSPWEIRMKKPCVCLIQFHWEDGRKPFVSILITCAATEFSFNIGFMLLLGLSVRWWKVVNNSEAFCIYSPEASVQAGKHLTPVLSSLQGERCYIHRHASQIKENTLSAAFLSHLKHAYSLTAVRSSWAI